MSIGAYKIAGRLGIGGMGMVYRAHRRGTATEVALKVLSATRGLNPNAVARFEREARILTLVNGACTARVLDCGMIDATPFLVMELLDGESLHDRVTSTGPLPASEVVDLAGCVPPAVVALLAFRSPGLRRLQDDLPDVTPEDRLTQATPGASVPVGVTESAPGGRST